ncbi:MAG TPA: DUF5655 domain-containing protein [Longimicrobium sp.]
MDTAPGYTVDALLADASETVRQTYGRLLIALRGFGEVAEDAKKTSIHLAPGPEGPAFAGVHPRKSALLLNVRSAAAIDGPRIRKTEQVSRNRFHNELLLATPDDVDAELVGWLRDAYQLAAAKR